MNIECVTGVHSGNDVEFFYEDRDSISLAYEEHLKECKGQCINCYCNHKFGKCECRDVRPDYKVPCTNYEPDEGCHDMCFCSNGDDTTLYGDWHKDRKSSKWKEYNGKKEYSAIHNENYNTIQVVKSNWIAKSYACSPCYPGQADLDTTGDLNGYCLPPELMKEEWVEENRGRLYFITSTELIPYNETMLFVVVTNGEGVVIDNIRANGGIVDIERPEALMNGLSLNLLPIIEGFCKSLTERIKGGKEQ